MRSSIRVIVPGQPARALNGTMTDISATGMRLLSNEMLNVGDILAIEVEHRLILAEIRYCGKEGDRFVAGVQRLHEIDKSVQPSDSAACVSEMIRDLHGHITARGETDIEKLAVSALEKILEKSVTGGSCEAEAAERASEPSFEKVLAWKSEPETSSSQSDSESESEIFIAWSEEARPECLTPAAASVPAPLPVRSGRPLRFSAAAALIIATGLALYDLHPPAEARVIGSPASEPSPLAVAATHKNQRPPMAKLPQVEITAKDLCWLSLAIDGTPSFEGLMRPGDSRRFEFSDSAVLQFGNAAAVKIALDGVLQPPLESSVHMVQLTHKGLRKMSSADY